MSIKAIFVSAAAAFFSISAHAGINFQDDARLLGCGVVTSVRESSQAPLYDMSYEERFGGNGSTVGVAAAAVNAGIVGILKAAVISTAVDAARGPSDVVNNYKVVANEEAIKESVVVQVTMDNGKVLNLPLMRRPRFGGPRAYDVGSRFQVFYLNQPEVKTFQLGYRLKPAAPDEKAYKWHCPTNVASQEAEEAYQWGENLAK